MELIEHGVKSAQVSLNNSSKYAKEAYEKLLETINARYILTSYSTDGNIEPKDLLTLLILKRGKVDFANSRCTARYRVSKQRQSERCTCA